jgi:hypothetical protein
MIIDFRSFAALSVAAALGAFAGTARGQSLDAITAPGVPASIQVPEGNVPFLKGAATGTQNYICMPSASSPTGYGWTFFGPQATLFLTLKWFNGDIRQQITTHYLSPNPTEGGTPRATWQSSLDTSAVWARAIANSTDPAYVAEGAIPWLLLMVVGKQSGPTGGASLTSATYLHRVNTTGGIAPATGCSQAGNAGATAFVPYTADYIFYRARRN